MYSAHTAPFDSIAPCAGIKKEESERHFILRFSILAHLNTNLWTLKYLRFSQDHRVI